MEPFEYRAVIAPLEVREVEEGVKAMVVGLAAPWNRTTIPAHAIKERFLPNAFGNDLDKLDVQVSLGHFGPTLGRSGAGLELRNTDEGLEATIELALNETAGRDAYSQLKRGVLRGLSAEMRTVSTQFVAGVREVGKASLAGLAIVVKPAYPGTNLVEIRSACCQSEAASLTDSEFYAIARHLYL